MSVDQLTFLTQQLQEAAAQLRGGELEPQQAARVVEECARIAGDAAGELERRVRAAADGTPAAPAAPVAAGARA